MKIFNTAVDPEHRYSNESERVNEDTYDDFKWKKIFWSPWIIQKLCQRFKGWLLQLAKCAHNTHFVYIYHFLYLYYFVIHAYDR